MENKMSQPIIDSEVSSFQQLHHIVNVPTTTVTMRVSSLPVKDHFLWSIFNFVYCNVCCLGFLALVFSVKSRDLKVVGDVSGAQHYSSTSRSLNLATTILSALVFLIVFILMVSGVIHVYPH